jgi:hypothetical protein
MSDEALDIIMQASWAGCIQWAAGDESVITRFERETGKKFPRRARSGIERLVDGAAGFDPFDDFVEWVTRELFGWEDAPKAYRDAVEARSGGRP